MSASRLRAWLLRYRSMPPATTNAKPLQSSSSQKPSLRPNNIGAKVNIPAVMSAAEMVAKTLFNMGFSA